MIAKTKSDMARFLADAMFSSYDRYRSEQKLEQDTGLLKSYFIEAHIDDHNGETNHDSIFTHLCQLSQNLKIRIDESEDESLFNITHGKDTYYLDTSDIRFWLMHTLALSTRADKLRNELIKASPSLDNAWLPAQFLEKITKFGHFKGFGAVHDETPLMDKSSEAEVESMHLRLWGGSAATVLESLHRSKALMHSLALSSVRIKYWLPEYEDEAVTDNFTFEGKVTALGKSFISHTNLISKVYSEYSATIRNIEKELSIGFVSRQGVHTLEGHPIIISLTRKVEDLTAFISHIFSSALPFRLWGLPEIITDDFARVYAVDLHVGHKLLFEVSSDFIRIYLPLGTCGNTIARFYTNIQQYYDSMASISGGSHERLFQKS